MSEANYTIEQSTQEVLLDKAFETTAARKINFEKLARSRAFLSAVIIVLALAIILFALFVPLSRSFADIDGFEVDIKYNGIDVFRLFYYSVLSLSPEGVRSTELYKTTEEMYFDFFGSGQRTDSLSFSEKRELSKICENMLMITLMGEENGLRFQLVLASLALVVLLLISAVMLYFAGMSLYAELQAKGKNSEILNTLFRKQLHSLWLMTALLPAFVYSFFAMGNWGIGNNLSLFSSRGAGVSVGSVFVILLSVLAAALSVVHFILNGKKKFPKPNPAVRRKVILIIAVFLIVMSLFLPVITVRFTSVRGSNVESKGLFIGHLGVLSADDLEYYRNTTRSENKEALTQIATEIFKNKSDKDALTGNVLNTLVLGVGRTDIRDFYVFIQLISYLIFILSAILMIYLARNLFEKINCYKAISRLKILIALLVITEAILEIVVLTTSSKAIDADLSSVISLGIGMGPVISILLSVFVMFFGIVHKRVSNTIDTWYDNADVSYAPYVIKKAKKN